MGVDITIKMDTKDFEERLNKSAREVVKGLRSAVNKAAREARREFVDAAARDTGLVAARFAAPFNSKPRAKRISPRE